MQLTRWSQQDIVVTGKKIFQIKFKSFVKFQSFILGIIKNQIHQRKRSSSVPADFDGCTKKCEELNCTNQPSFRWLTRNCLHQITCVCIHLLRRATSCNLVETASRAWQLRNMCVCFVFAFQCVCLVSSSPSVPSSPSAFSFFFFLVFASSVDLYPSVSSLLPLSQLMLRSFTPTDTERECRL